MGIFKTKDNLLFPSDREQVGALIKKWRITDEQLADAIIETGSIHTTVLREHFIRKGVLFSFASFFEKLIGRK